MLFRYLFFVGSIGGFFIELFYRRLVLKKWVKPGVFKGFYLPLYGIGLVICYLCYMLEWHIIFKVFLTVILLTCIELICGVIFIKKLKIDLWNYSNEYLNYKGLICIKFSFYWLLLSLISFMFFKNINICINNLLIFFIGVFEIILAVDVVLFFASKIITNKKNNFHLDL